MDHSHPLFTRSYLLATDALDGFTTAVQKWIFMGHVGGFVYGKQRMGKSYSLHHLRKYLKNRSGEPFPIFSFSSADKTLVTDTKLFSTIYAGFGGDPGRLSTNKLKVRIVTLLKGAALKTTDGQVLIFVDEAQKLTAKEWSFLSDLFNDLKDAGINCFFLSIGSEELKENVESYRKEEKYRSVRGRFFCNSYEVNGIRHQLQLQKILQQFDNDLTWPERSGVTYTRYFLPQAFDAGFRVAKLDESLWHEYSKLANGHDLSGWPMQYFCSTIVALLADMLVDGSSLQIVDEQIIRGAIIASGIEEYF